MSSIRVGVLRGGPSLEHEVSLKTGESVLRNLPEKYSAKDIFISKRRGMAFGRQARSSRTDFQAY